MTGLPHFGALFPEIVTEGRIIEIGRGGEGTANDGIQSTAFVFDSFYECRDFFVVGYVHWHWHRSPNPPHCFDLLCCSIHGIIPTVLSQISFCRYESGSTRTTRGDVDGHSRPAQFESDALADAAGGAGDNRDFLGEIRGCVGIDYGGNGA